MLQWKVFFGIDIPQVVNSSVEEEDTPMEKIFANLESRLSRLLQTQDNAFCENINDDVLIKQLDQHSADHIQVNIQDWFFLLAIELKIKSARLKSLSCIACVLEYFNSFLLKVYNALKLKIIYICMQVDMLFRKIVFIKNHEWTFKNLMGNFSKNKWVVSCLISPWKRQVRMSYCYY